MFGGLEGHTYASRDKREPRAMKSSIRVVPSFLLEVGVTLGGGWYQGRG